MRKGVFWFVAPVLLIWAALGVAQQPLKDAATKLVEAVVKDPDCEKLKGELLVISEFDNINARSDAVPRILQEMLITAFVKAKHFRVAERTQLVKAMQELKIDASGLTDPANQKQLGKLLGANFILLGSISEMNNALICNCRLVKIESGENITAADATVGAAEAPPVQGGQPASADGGTAKPGYPGPSPANTPARRTEAVGTWAEGGKPSIWTAGGRDIRVAWREKLDDKITTFCAGNLTGQGTRLAGVGHQDAQRGVLVVWKWQANEFRRQWQSPETYADESALVRLAGAVTGPQCLLLTPMSRRRADGYLWERGTYARQETYVAEVFGTVLGQPVVVVTQGGALMERSPDGPTGAWKYSSGAVASGARGLAAADFDGDKQLELAVWPDPESRAGIGADVTDAGEAAKEMFSGRNSRRLQGGAQIAIFDTKGARKAVTQGKYGPVMTAWQPTDTRFPYIVARRNDFQPVEGREGEYKNIGGYVYLIQYDGETYNEVWKSPKIGDAVLDVQVCDPKGEGSESLVVLSEDATGSYLTRFVVE